MKRLTAPRYNLAERIIALAAAIGMITSLSVCMRAEQPAPATVASSVTVTKHRFAQSHPRAIPAGSVVDNAGSTNSAAPQAY